MTAIMHNDDDEMSHGPVVNEEFSVSRISFRAKHDKKQTC